MYESPSHTPLECFYFSHHYTSVFNSNTVASYESSTNYDHSLPLSVFIFILTLKLSHSYSRKEVHIYTPFRSSYHFYIYMSIKCYVCLCGSIYIYMCVSLHPTPNLNVLYFHTVTFRGYLPYNNLCESHLSTV